ncbi:cupredoxin family copper-binding protein [Lentzea sp. NEAU-D13]|uniref:Cupredoxin family copper-binding protein n=1 Tax=Lentzea alba TaxID=2714351 RepID=A0A7C9VY61_9PSEU|nr:cupredoxin family copper-binding protein [Lentzea alba]NGY61938.1 cupredoxin family copper-binding protein [Lentzea alba]
MRRGLASAVLAAFAVLILFSTAPATGAETHSIPIAQHQYQPASMTVRVGDVVTWTNQDQAPHDVAAGTFRSPMLSTGQSWSYTFTQPGTFDYVCSIHPDMRARIVVQPAEPVAPQHPATHEPAPQPAVATTTTEPPTTTAPPSVETEPAVIAAPPAEPPSLQPMLLLAGLVAAVTTLCLLVIGSRPERESP